MNLEFGLTDDFTNTQFAALAALSARYQHDQLLASLENVDPEMKTRDFRRFVSSNRSWSVSWPVARP